MKRTDPEEVFLRGRWKSLLSRLFGGRDRRTGREKVLRYIARRLDEGVRLQGVTRQGYVRRMATPGGLEQMLADPRIVEGARRRMRRDLTPENAPPGTT